NNEHLTIEEMKEATTLCLQQSTSEAEMGAFLTALRVKGETADEVTGIVEVIRSHSPLHSLKIDNVIDNCGTGGDHSNSFNISTTTAFVLAGAGITVPKHGNRSISSSTGSADVLEYLGVSLSLTDEQTEEMLQKNQISFLFAPHVHSVMKHFMNVRRALKIPTIFNMIGPLTNPIELDSQLLGVYDRDLLPIMAQSLNKLGRKRAVIVNGAGQMDEASLAGKNHLILLDDGKIIPFTLTPEDVKLPTYTLEDIKGGDAKQNANILLSVLRGEKSPYLDTVLLNAALGFYAHGLVDSPLHGVELAKESIYSGAALKRLQTLIDYSKQITEEVS